MKIVVTAPKKPPRNDKAVAPFATKIEDKNSLGNYLHLLTVTHTKINTIPQTIVFSHSCLKKNIVAQQFIDLLKINSQ